MDAYVGLGSNLDDPLKHVLDALDELRVIRDSHLVAVSDVYQSAPMLDAETSNNTQQPDYINAAAQIDTRLTPATLLTELQAIENRHGRKRSGQRWGARTLDLDLLVFGDHILDTPELKLPHPGVSERDFVLIPLSDINPELMIPGKHSVSSLLNNCKSHRLVKIMTIERVV